jgi:hypothetical protein
MKIMYVFTTLFFFLSCICCTQHSYPGTKPTVTIQYPVANQFLGKRIISVKGEVHDWDGYAEGESIKVFLSLNNSLYQLIVETNYDFSSEISLERGSNVIKVKAIDPQGNESDIKEVSVFSETKNVYLAGYEWGSSYKTACYWENGMMVDLMTNPSNDSYARAIYVYNNDIYVAGYYNGSYDVACYWKNGVRTDLHTTSLAHALSIFVTADHVYVSGDQASGFLTACYWIDGVRTDLGTSDSSAKSILVSGSDIYTAGNYYLAGRYEACYWKNSTRIDLETLNEGSYAYSMFIYNNDIYIAGIYVEHIESEYISKACYWKNGTRTNLTTDNEYAVARSIFVTPIDVYVGGQKGYLACYWRNGEIQTYGEPNTDIINSIWAIDSDLYLSGQHYYSASYYVNSDLYDFIENYVMSMVYGMFVVE